MSTHLKQTVPKDLPQLIGKKVQLGGLKVTYFNGKIGSVIGFSPKNKRFAVKLDENGHIKYFKACNVTPLFKFSGLSQFDNKLQQLINLISRDINFDKKKYLSSHDDKKFDEGLKIIQWLEQNRLGEATETEIIFKSEWCKFNLLHFSDYPQRLKTVKLILQNMLAHECNQNEELFVHVKLIFAMTFQSEPKKFFEFFEQYCMKHFGYFPQFAGQILNYGLLEPKHFKSCYDKAKNIIESKNYNSRCDIAQFYLRSMHMISDDEYVSEFMDPKERAFELRKLISFIHLSVEDYTDIMKDDTNAVFSTTLGKILMLEEKYEDALVHFKSYLDHNPYGRNKIMFLDTISEMFYCYAKIGNKKDAKKCMKQLKKFGGLKADMEEIYNKIDFDEEEEKNPKLSFQKPLKECSYFRCHKTEQKLNEFKKCSACEQVYY